MSRPRRVSLWRHVVHERLDVGFLDLHADVEVAQLEGISSADASVILLARDRDERLLATDRGLIQVAETHDVEAWWITTLLLHCANAGTLSADAATDVLYELVDDGLNLDPKLYARVQRKLEELGA